MLQGSVATAEGPAGSARSRRALTGPAVVVSDAQLLALFEPASSCWPTAPPRR